MLAIALRLDPLDPMAAFQMAGSLFGDHQHEQSIAVLRRAIVHTPDFMGLYGLLTVNYVELGRLEEARAALAELERINPDFTVEQLESRNLVGVPYRSRVVAAARKAGMKSQEAE